MSKRERILSVTTGIFGVLAVVLAIIMILQIPTGKVDIGYGYEVSQKEFDEYYAMAEQTTKDVLVELKIALDAAKELGVTITDEQIQQETDSMNLIYNYEKGSVDYIELKINAAISLIENQCIEKYKEKINPEEAEINELVTSMKDKLTVDCDFKTISTAEGIVARLEKVKFEDVESKYTVTDAGTEFGAVIEKEDGIKVGDTVIQPNGEENYVVLKINKIYETDEELRGVAVNKLKEDGATKEFYTYMNDYYEKKMAETPEDTEKADKSVDTAGNAE